MRIVKALMLCAIVYMVPLLLQPEGMLDPRILLASAMALIMVLSQPELNRDAADRRDKNDRLSVLGILVASVLGQSAAVIEWAYVRDMPAIDPWWLIVGIVMMTLGLAYRIWAIRTLGKFFTAKVTVADDHRVVRTGPYRLLRHPSYLGATVAFLGTAAALQSWVAAFLSVIVLGAAYVYRISVEEEALSAQLGSAYREYQATTSRLLPRIW